MSWGATAPLTFPDAERAVVDYLAARLVGTDAENVTVGVGVPAGFTTDSRPHVEIDWAGTPGGVWPVLADATIRVVVHVAPQSGADHASTTEAKRLAARALAWLGAHPGGNGIATVVPLTGPLPARDPDSRVELATVTCRVTVRSTT